MGGWLMIKMIFLIVHVSHHYDDRHTLEIMINDKIRVSSTILPSSYHFEIDLIATY